MKNPAIKKYIKERTNLFWYIKENEKNNISKDFLVETILNWGNRTDIKELIKLLGIREVAKIFYKATSGKRTNYRKKAINFFNLYFEKFSHRNPYRKSEETPAVNKGFF